MLDDESDDDGSGSGSAGTCAFPFHNEEYFGHVDNSVGCVRGVGSGIFLIGIESIGDVFLLVMFVSMRFDSKGG